MNRVLEVAKLLVKEILRKKDFYVAFVLTAFVLFYAAQLRFFGVSSASRYLMDLGLMLCFFFGAFLTVALAARQFPGECRDKTLHVLLARPISRAEYLCGKFLGAWFAGAVVSAAFFVALLAVLAAKTVGFSWGLAIETYFIFILGLGVLAALAVLLSLVLTPTSNVSMTIATYLLINLYGFHWNESAQRLPVPSKWISQVLYYLLPHFEFFDIRQRLVHGWPGPPPGVVVFLVVYAAFYIFLFLFAGQLILRRKTIS